jgi:hypothetical protein
MEAVLEKAEIVSLKNHPFWDEAFVQQLIADDPNILGLGPLLLRDKERAQPHKGRLDLLFQSGDATAWYEVEVQLGPTDEQHIIRTIEYWDVERKRYPDLQHTAVIIAEEITSRFFNVINLFNQAIPIVALKLSAVKIGDRTALVFTKVLDYERKGTEAAEEIVPQVDRTDWEDWSSSVTMSLADQVLLIAKDCNSKVEFRFYKSYISTTLAGMRSSLLMFRPQKRVLKLSVNLEQSPELDKLCYDAGFDVKYDPYWWGYQFDIRPDDFETHRLFFKDLIQRLYVPRS